MRRFLARARAPPPGAGGNSSAGRGVELAEERQDATYPSYAEVRQTPPPSSSWHRDAKGEGLPSLLPGLRQKKSESVDDGPRRRRPPLAFRKRTPAVDLSAELQHLEVSDARPSRHASEDAVPVYIADFCHAEVTDDDWECVHELGELVNQSPAHSKAALRALQHELKGPHVSAQCRAVRMWGVWSMHEGRYFAEVATHSQLLAQLEDILTNPLTYPTLRADTFLVVGALASRSRHNDRLHKIARLWARTRPSTSPEHGVPLTAPLFQDGALPTADAPPAIPPALVPPMPPSPIPRHTKRVPDALAPAPPPAVPLSLTPSPSSNGSYHTSVDLDEGRREFLEEECRTAKMNAELFTEMALSGENDEALFDEVRAKIRGAQYELEPHLTWAAERASALDGEAQRVAEELLHTMLSALSSASEALALHDTQSDPGSDDASEEAAPAVPSAKALGKRRAVDEPFKPPLPPVPSP
ncbi:hypothetical protein MCAP1_000416 [Malassezia caprae]|uniref:VHS domain-containing protein n=1 Tax=Malassezia caprae TaxID=1381934 RepID=A0AAF0E3G2_9BASI|nr:hypothetical protein MCAP1_000416 [Malassezia caprae]